MLHARRTPSSVARLRSHGYVSSHSPDMLVWGLAIAAEYLASHATVRGWWRLPGLDLGRHNRPLVDLFAAQHGRPADAGRAASAPQRWRRCA